MPCSPKRLSTEKVCFFPDLIVLDEAVEEKEEALGAVQWFTARFPPAYPSKTTKPFLHRLKKSTAGVRRGGLHPLAGPLTKRVSSNLSSPTHLLTHSRPPVHFTATFCQPGSTFPRTVRPFQAIISFPPPYQPLASLIWSIYHFFLVVICTISILLFNGTNLGVAQSSLCVSRVSHLASPRPLSNPNRRLL